MHIGENVAILYFSLLLMFTAMVMFMKETGSMICAKDMESWNLWMELFMGSVKKSFFPYLWLKFSLLLKKIPTNAALDKIPWIKEKLLKKTPLPSLTKCFIWSEEWDEWIMFQNMQSEFSLWLEIWIENSPDPCNLIERRILHW